FDRPTVFSTLTQTPIAVARSVWTSNYTNLVDWICLENNFTRFRLGGDGSLLLGWNRDADRAWLSQASSVFYARGVSFEGDLMDFKLVRPRAWLDGYLDNSPSKCRQRRQQPIYLFLHPPPFDFCNGYTSSLHHWSFQEDGQSQLSLETCHNLGLPIDLHLDVFGSNTFSWSTNHHKSLHHYQVLRGFDPTTTDFARHLGYHHIFQPHNDDNWLEDACNRASACLESDLDHHRSAIGVDPEHPSTTQEPEGSLIYGSDVHVNGFAPAFTAKADPNTANGRCWMSNTSSGINNQGYLDQVFFDDGGEYRRCNSYSGVEMLGTSDDLNARNFQHTTATTSDDKSFPTTVWPVTALSTPPEGLEDAIDDYDGSFTSTCDPNIDELCGLLELLTVA
ncbi:hypothetical protein PQX77_013741, partial [Marasmius sp. AFHP31]